MSRTRAALGSAMFLLVAPGVVAGLVPYLLTDWDARETARSTCRSWSSAGQ